MRVLDVDPDEEPPRRVHRRVPELVMVHLAETLVARELDPDLLREVQCALPQLGEARRFEPPLAERERERRRADELDQLAVGAAEVGVDGRGEQLRRDLDGLRSRGLLLDDLDAEPRLAGLQYRELEAVRRELRDLLLERGRRDGIELD